VVDSLPVARLLLLVSYRPEYEHQWVRKSCYAHLRVDPLPAQHATSCSAQSWATIRPCTGSRAWALRLAAEVALAQGLESADRAAEHYRAALALATDLEMRPLQAHCHLGLGKLYRRIGRADDAHIELSDAITLLDELGMALWFSEARAELAAAHH
jgi:tetratricopeptide (TPR) repeat protein